jgi:hypothetical protein
MKHPIIITIAALAISASSALALQVGDSATIAFKKSPYQSGTGGEFWARTTPVQVAGYSLEKNTRTADGYFATFCLEKGEKLSYGGPQDATIAYGAWLGGLGGGSPDPVSIGTAYLYSQFATGQLDGYDYTAPGRIASASVLQECIWYLEDELNTISGNLFYDMVFAMFADPKADANGAYNTFAVNVTRNGLNRQDVLIYIPSSVPDGGMTLALLGLGLAGVGVASRRRLA